MAEEDLVAKRNQGPNDVSSGDNMSARDEALLNFLERDANIGIRGIASLRELVVLNKDREVLSLAEPTVTFLKDQAYKRGQQLVELAKIKN